MPTLRYFPTQVFIIINTHTSRVRQTDRHAYFTLHTGIYILLYLSYTNRKAIITNCFNAIKHNVKQQQATINSNDNFLDQTHSPDLCWKFMQNTCSTALGLTLKKRCTSQLLKSHYIAPHCTTQHGMAWHSKAIAAIVRHC